MLMSRAVTIPLGSWPLEMTADVAAGYCGEPSTDSFSAKVAKGYYPQPTKCRGMLPKWHRAKLEAVIAQRHGLQLGSSIAEDVTELIG
jgi:hypothetical protein